MTTLLLSYALKTDLDLKLDLATYNSEKVYFLNSSNLVPYRTSVN